MERIDRVAKPANFTDFLKQPRRHSATQNIGEHLQTVRGGIALLHAFETDGNMHLLEIALLDAGAADELRRLRRGRSRTIERRETALHFLDDSLVVHRTGSADDHVGALVVTRQVRAELLAVE